jgi:hypothetical protein
MVFVFYVCLKLLFQHSRFTPSPKIAKTFLLQKNRDIVSGLCNKFQFKILPGVWRLAAVAVATDRRISPAN